jgi:hypothetical protein
VGSFQNGANGDKSNVIEDNIGARLLLEQFITDVVVELITNGLNR